MTQCHDFSNQCLNFFNCQSLSVPYVAFLDWISFLSFSFFSFFPAVTDGFDIVQKALAPCVLSGSLSSVPGTSSVEHYYLGTSHASTRRSRKKD